MTSQEKFRQNAYKNAHRVVADKKIPHGTVNVKMFKAHPVDVQERYQRWIQQMTRDYPEFEIIAQSQSAYPAGVVLYITYRV